MSEPTPTTGAVGGDEVLASICSRHRDEPVAGCTACAASALADIAAAAVPSPETGDHAYVSTACHHGLHERCRRACKFCPATCQCGCGHEGEQ